MSTSGEWKQFYLVFSQMFFDSDYLLPQMSGETVLSVRGEQTSTARHFPTVYDTFYKLMKNINQLLPLFNFYIYKVDKRIYKNTRGRSGKYTFI